MKYIIEIEEMPFKSEGAELQLYKATEFNSLVFDKIGLEKLIPYNESEAEQRGIDKAWEFARHLYNISPYITEQIYLSMNGGKGLGVALEMSYTEAKADYDAWRKQKDGIKIGDEVDRNGIKGVVCWIGEDEVCGICPNVGSEEAFITFSWDKNETLKTGRNV